MQKYVNTFFIDLMGDTKIYLKYQRKKFDLHLTAVENNQPTRRKRKIFTNTQNFER